MIRLLADVADLEGRRVAELMLYGEVVLLRDCWANVVGIEGVDASSREAEGRQCDGGCSGATRSGEAGETLIECCGGEGLRTACVGNVERNREGWILNEEIAGAGAFGEVRDAVGTANDRCLKHFRLPGKTYAGLEVGRTVVLVVKSLGVTVHPCDLDGSSEESVVGRLVVGLSTWGDNLVAKAKIEREVGAKVPVILSERRDDIVAEATTASGAQANVLGQTEEEVGLGPADGSCAGRG